MSNLINISKLPTGVHIHVWADYVEISCLIDPDLTFLKSMLSDDYNEALDQDVELVEDDENISKSPDRLTSPNDARETLYSDIFLHLKYRSSVFGEMYPFEIKHGVRLVRKNVLSDINKLYIFFLLASHLSWIDDRIKQKSQIPQFFEYICEVALINHLPQSAKVHIFGKGKYLDPDFPKKLFKRIEVLAGLLHLSLECKEKDFDPKNSGDDGLDLVAYVPFSDADRAPGQLVVFVQSACTEEWVTKQRDISFQKWSRRIKFIVAPTEVVIIPFCFRDSNGSWHKSVDVETILLDRVRLAHLLNNNPPSLSKNIEVQNIIDNICVPHVLSASL